MFLSKWMQHTALVDKTKIITMFVILSSSLSDLTLSSWVVSFLWTRFYNNAAKIFGTETVLCRRFVNLVFMTAYKESGSSWKSKNSRLSDFFEKILPCAEDYAEGCNISISLSIAALALIGSFCLLKLWNGRLFLSKKWLSTICQTDAFCGIETSCRSTNWRIR